MHITIDRRWPKAGYTISEVYIDGEKQPYNCLEDTDRGLTQQMTGAEIARIKVRGQTAIPRGTYRCVSTYSPKYRRRMPLLLGVRGFEGIRIHAGNSSKDTEGCLLFGKNDRKGWVSDSKHCTALLTARLNEAWAKGEQCTVTVAGPPPA